MRRTRAFYLNASEPEEAPMNLTPLIDVVFVVLIMFILVAPMLELDRIQLASASSRENKEMAIVQENSSLSIHVKEDNTIWFNGRRVAATELLSLLQTAKKCHPNQNPQLFHDKKATFGTYQTIKNTAELAGFEELDVILQPG